MGKVRVALIGFGGICSSVHVPSYRTIPNVEIVAVCDIVPAKLEKAKQVLGHNIATYTDYKQCIDEVKPDMVDICTPNYMHSPIACYALEHGVHAFSEKPDSISVEDVIKMREAELKSGKHLMVMRNNRHRPTTKYLKEMIANGEFGEIYTGRCGWIRRRGIPGKGGWFTTKEQSGGGPLIDLGVHMLDLAVYLMGNPKVVSVSGSTYSKFADSDDKADSVHSNFGEAVEGGTFDVEDLAIGFIKFDNGASLQLEFSWASNIKQETNFVELRGTKKGCNWHDGKLDVFCEPKLSCIEKWKMKKDMTKKYGVIDRGHRDNLKHFIDVITNDADPDFTIDQGINMIKILCGIYESAKPGKEVVFD